MFCSVTSARYKIIKACKQNNYVIIKEGTGQSYKGYDFEQEKENSLYIKQLLREKKINDIFINVLYIEKKFITLEYAKGENLDYILEYNFFTVERLRFFLIKISEGISLLENNKCQHMNLIGSNIMIDLENDIVKILDYGVMITPNVKNFLFDNINYIYQIPYTHIGYGMYTLIRSLLYNSLIPHNLKKCDEYYSEYLTEYKDEDKYIYILKHNKEFAIYLKNILDTLGNVFIYGENNNSSSFSIDEEDENKLKKLKTEETKNIKNYSGDKVLKYLIKNKI